MVPQHDIKGSITINAESDIIAVRKATRKTAETLGFGITDITRIVTASSELARNIYRYAGTGKVNINKLNTNGNLGIELVFIDNGPGIPDVELAMESGYTTSGGLGMGLPGTNRLMDEMEIESDIGKGTTVKVKKWLKRMGNTKNDRAINRGYTH